jgi:glycosyltransferase involved in cell wall biosynthesis
MRNKKIICAVTNDLSYDQRMQRICASLVKAGYEVELVGRERRASVPLREQPFRQTRLRCRWEKGKLFYLEYNLRLLLYLLFSRFDQLCAVDLDTIVPVWIAGRLKGGRLIFDAHEYFEEVPEVVRRPFVQKIWAGVARRFIPRMDRCYTVGPALAERFKALYGKPFGVVRNLPYRQEGISPRALPEKPLFLYQGALNEGRGLEALIGVMSAFPHAELWLAGEGDLSETLRQMVREQGLEAQVRFLGYVQPADLPALTQQATIGFNLLENKGLSYYYSLANKAFDYIQAGLPSVQMDFPEYRRLQEEYGVFQLVADLQPATLIPAIRHLLEDKEYYSQMSQSCLAAAAELCWEREEVFVGVKE